MIPKIIHYCWLSNDPIPEKLQICMNSWKKKLPDYKFMLWNFERFDINSSIWVKQAFEARKYAFAADYIRLYAIYNYGGIYLDMDVEIIKPFANELIQKNYMLAYESEDHSKGIEAGVIGGEKGAEWLKDCLEYYKERSFISETGTFNTTPLPRIMMNILNNKYISKNIIEPLSFDYFTAKCYENGKIKTTKNTYTIHHFEGSWFSKTQKIKRIIIHLLGKKSMFLIRKYIK